jgi:hypothetical protein
MNEPEANFQNTPASMDVHEAHESLRAQINLLFGALIVSSFILTAYLGVEAKRVWIDYNASQPQVEAAARTFQQENAAFQMDMAKLQEFGRTHPDFQKQVLAKYNILPPPAAAPAPKK